MALQDNQQDTHQFLYEYTGKGNETVWNRIKTAIDQGADPTYIPTGLPFSGGQYDPDRISFLGIEGEARFVGPGGMHSPTGTVSVANGVPRMILPNSATTDIFITLEFEEWWLARSINIGFEYINEAASSGNIRFQFELKEIDIGSQGPATAETVPVVSRTQTWPSGPAGTSQTGIVAAVLFGVPFRPQPGPIASFYALRLTRLGNDAADTLNGDVGIAAINWGRDNTP